jgi:hypothetical protein
MEAKFEKLLTSCSELDFGAVNLSEGEIEFYHQLNNEIISLCKSLPESTQTEAIIFSIHFFHEIFGPIIRR